VVKNWTIDRELEGSDPASLPSAGNGLFRMIRLGLNLKNCTVCLYLLHLYLSVIFSLSVLAARLEPPILELRVERSTTLP
jgi:hypothetical protein